MHRKRIKPTPGFKRSVCAVAALMSFLPASAPFAATPNSEFVQAIYRGEATPRQNGVATAADPDIERRFNDLRRELLDDRSKQVDWWLAATAIFLTTISVLAVLGGYVSFRRFRAIESDARINADKSQQYASEAGALLKQIEEARDAANSMVENMSAETVKNEPDRALDIARKIDNNPGASLLDKAVSAAITLQGGGNMDMALDKWRAVADVLAGSDSDSDLERRAWFSVGYISQESDPPDMEAAIDAYDKAINIDSAYAAAYNNRGNAKAALGRHEDAITDHDKAIQLERNFAEAYSNRGNAKDKLGRYDEAIADYDKAIQLKPDFAGAYNNRGNAKDKLGRYDEAIADYDEAIRINPDDAKAFFNRGVTKAQQDLIQESRSDFERAIALARDANNDDLVSNAEAFLETMS